MLRHAQRSQIPGLAFDPVSDQADTLRRVGRFGIEILVYKLIYLARTLLTKMSLIKSNIASTATGVNSGVLFSWYYQPMFNITIRSGATFEMSPTHKTSLWESETLSFAMMFWTILVSAHVRGFGWMCGKKGGTLGEFSVWTQETCVYLECFQYISAFFFSFFNYHEKKGAANESFW
jgi:hypothetical protein